AIQVTSPILQASIWLVRSCSPPVKCCVSCHYRASNPTLLAGRKICPPLPTCVPTAGDEVHAAFLPQKHESTCCFPGELGETLCRYLVMKLHRWAVTGHVVIPRGETGRIPAASLSPRSTAYEDRAILFAACTATRNSTVANVQFPGNAWRSTYRDCAPGHDG